MNSILVDGKFPSPVYPDPFLNNVNTHPFDWSLGNGNVQIDKHPPKKPKNLYLVEVSSNTVMFGCDLSENVVGFAFGYRVYQDDVLVVPFIDRPSFFITGLSPSTEYSFTVSAVNENGDESNDSNNLLVTTSSAGSTLPEAPTNFRAGMSPSGSSVYLHWDPSAVDTTGYELYQDGVLIKTIAAGSGSFITQSAAVHGLAQDTQYVFTVKAFDLASNLSDAATFTTRTTVSSTPVITNFTVSNFTETAPSSNEFTTDLAWSIPTFDDEGTIIPEILVDNVHAWDLIDFGVLLDHVVDGSATSWTTQAISAGLDYELVLRAADVDGNSLGDSAPIIFDGGA